MAAHDAPRSEGAALTSGTLVSHYRIVEPLGATAAERLRRQIPRTRHDQDRRSQRRSE